MIGERIIKKLIRDRIIGIVDKHVKDPKTRDECIEGITEVAMEMVKIIGVRQIIWYLWYAKRRSVTNSILRQCGKSGLVTQNIKNFMAIRDVHTQPIIKMNVLIVTSPVKTLVVINIIIQCVINYEPTCIVWFV